MCDLVARTGRLQQRYKDGSRLIAGYCVLTHALYIVSLEFMLWFCNVILLFYLKIVGGYIDHDYTCVVILNCLCIGFMLLVLREIDR